MKKCETQTQDAKAYEKQDFWDNKSRTYPAFEKDAYDTLQILDFFAENGADLSGEVLEIGCGTGRFTLQLAFRAKSVLGVDFSAGMLAKLTQKAHELNLTNVRTQNLSWQDFCMQDTRVFDAVFAAMTPALDGSQSVREVAKRTQRHFCYVGWGDNRNDIYTAIYDLHGVEKGCIMHFARFVELANEAGFRLVKKADFWRDKHYTATPSEALADFRTQIERKGVAADEASLAEFIAQHTRLYEASDEAVKTAMKYGFNAENGVSASSLCGVENADLRGVSVENVDLRGVENSSVSGATSQDIATKNLNSQNSTQNARALQNDGMQTISQTKSADKIELFRYPYRRLNVALLFEKI